MSEDKYWNLIGAAISQMLTGSVPSALDKCSKAETIFPNRPETLCVLALCSYQMGEFGQGIDLMEKVHEQACDVRDYADILAVLLAKVGRLNDSLYYAKLSMALEPHEVLSKLIPDNLRDYKKALDESSKPAFYISAMIGLEDKDYDRCVKMCMNELSISKDAWAAYQLLGRAYTATGKPHQAVSALRVSVAKVPEEIGKNMSYLGNALLKSGEVSQAIEMFSESTIAMPENILAISNYKKSFEYLGYISNREKMVSLRINDLLKGNDEEIELFDFEPLDGRRVRIGFITDEFFDSELNHFLRILIKNIDKAKFETYAYKKNSFKDMSTTSFEQLFDEWRDFVDMDDVSAAYVLSSDEIDILIDCSGHGQGQSIGVLSHKPAHVVASWCLNAEKIEVENYDFDFLPSSLLEELPSLKDDKTIAIEGHGICIDGRSMLFESGRAVDPPCIKNSFITFGVFCELDKITPQAVSVWSRILHANTSCRIMFGGYGEIQNDTQTHLVELFSNYGIADRISFHTEWEDVSPVFSFLSHIDILLDPTPVSSALQTANALLKGVPVLALSNGERPASYTSARILKAAGCDDWIANTETEYWMKAVEMASNPSQLSEIRKTLRDTVVNSAFCDGEQFAKNFENACMEALKKKKLI